MKFSIRRARYRAARTRLSAPLIWIRHRGLKATDVFLASYPRSGQHWTRFQLFEILVGRPADFDTLDNTIPPVGRHHHAPAVLPGGGRLIQTHQRWRSEYKKAILLVRDVRDIVLSDYAWDESLDLTKYLDITDFNAYLRPWLMGATQTPGAGAWHDHLITWLQSPPARKGDLLVIRFEDMRQNTEGALTQMTEFLGVPVDRAAIQCAIANNSVARMRAKEDSSKKYDPKTVGRKLGEERRFVRKGSVGAWRDRLTEDQVQLIEQYAGEALVRLGYPTGRTSFAGKPFIGSGTLTAETS
jgi:Sulfotransferase domain